MAQEKMTTEQLVKEVKAHALRNYRRGWDTVVECYSDDDIARIIGGATTLRGAMAKMRAEFLPYLAYSDEIKSTAF